MKKTITLALLVVGKAQRLTRGADGYVDAEELKEFLKYVNEYSLSIREECPESCDSSLEVVFFDGSIARLANPRQEVFSFTASTEFDGKYYFG